MGSGGNSNPPPPPSANPAVQAVNAPSVFETMAQDKLKSWQNWENAPGAHDITAAPGMNDMLDIYGSADANQHKKQLSNPQMALSGGGSGDYANQINASKQMDQFDQRAEGLSHGYQSLKNEAYGLGGDAATIEAQRKQNYASDMLGQENAYYNRPVRPSTFEKIANLAIKGAGAASMFM
jgi:hypothetical protein